MAYCMNCGKELPDGAKFCFECGAAVTATSSSSSTQRKTVYDGEIHKCPNCGEILSSFVSNCPVCGYELRESKNSSAVRELAIKLEKIEYSRPSSQSGFKEMFKNQNGISKTDSEKISLIRSFPIPNTKEDLLEFLVLAASNIDLQRYNEFNSISDSEQAVSDAWEAKFEQAYQKAGFLIVSTPEFEQVRMLYEKKKAEVNHAKRMRVLFWILFPTIVLVLVFGLLILSNALL